MSEPSPESSRIDRLRAWRNRPDADLTLGFLDKQFKQQVARPYKQLQAAVELWTRLVPEPILSQTRLESMRGGVLRVAVASSATLYELDRLLRTGLQRELTTQYKAGTLRRVTLKIGPIDKEPPADRDQPRDPDWQQ